MVQKHMFDQACLAKRLPGQTLVEPCRFKSVLTTSLWVQQTCRQVCTRLWGQILVEPTLVQNNILTRLACTSLPGHKFVEPSLFRFVQNVFDPGSLYNLGQFLFASMPGHIFVEPTGTNLVQTAFDPARLYNRAG